MDRLYWDAVRNQHLEPKPKLAAPSQNPIRVIYAEAVFSGSTDFVVSGQVKSSDDVESQDPLVASASRLIERETLIRVFNVARSRPPRHLRNAVHLLSMLAGYEERDSIMGDLFERYSKKCELVGGRKAGHYVYIEIGRSLLPLLTRAIEKGLMFLIGECIKKFRA
jgi:hypothetical protein